MARRNRGGSDELLRLVYEATNDGIWEWDTRTGQSYFSPSYYTMLGYEPNEFPASYDCWRGLIHPEDREATEAVVQQSLEKRISYAVEFRMKGKNGEWIWILSCGKALEVDSEGRIIRMVGSHKDISQRKRDEDELREKDTLLHYISGLAKVGAWKFDPETGTSQWTDEVYRIFDLEPDQSASPTLGLSYFQGVNRERMEQAFKDAVEHGRSYDLELEIVSARGIHKWVRTICYPVTKDDQVILMWGSFQDVTEHKRMVESLRLTQFIFDQAPIGIWRMGENSRVLDVNEQGCSSLGYTPEELCSMSAYDFDPDYRPDNWVHDRSILNADGSRTFESRHRRKDGAIFPVQVILKLLRFEGQEFHVAFTQDITRRKQMEESLLLAHSIVDSANIGIVRIDSSGQIQHANRKAGEMLGYSREELEDLTLFDIDVKLNQELWNAHWQRLHFQDFQHLESTLRKKDGSAIPVEMNNYLLKYENQEYVIGFVRDITQRKKNEKELREKDRLLHDIGCQIKVGAWQVDLETGEAKTTDEVARIYDFDFGQEVSIEKCLSCYHGINREKIEQAFESLITHGVPYDLELEIFTAKGQPKWVRTTGQTVMNEGRVTKVQGAFQDITERKQAMLRLKESEKRYRSLIEFAPLGIGVIDSDGVIVDFNQAYAAMVGYETAELMGMNFADISHPDDLAREKEFINDLTNNDQASFSLEKRYKHKKGHYFWVNVTVGKAQDIYGPGLFYFGFLEDISARKQLEEDRNQLIKDLQNALAEIKELRGFLPICSKCKKIRDDDGYWQQVEKYITDRTDAQFSHSYCPECYKRELDKINRT